MSNLVYETARSVVVYLHKEAGIKICADLRQRLCDFMSGMRRKVASQRKENGVSIMEGKRKMSFQVYEKICELLLKNKKDEFAHCFLVLEWNLMARSQNVVDSHTSKMCISTMTVWIFSLAKQNVTRPEKTLINFT